ncbi:chromosome segregation SMC family protein [Deinococcus sp.]|uniref:AAA family ATPase n=1 Tax=Deinococcus sp. TaxID=47478 RepID=UPI0025BDB49E|nr:chromosome segregation SMC family protein [Deinococcus sp.]
MIESITLQGFKSFADRTRLEFGGGVCAVIGPNGSGKSNVVEAIRWATHGARARELRAGRGTELIFHGSGGKAALGLAEVQLELLTAGGRVNLTRRIYRDGSAEQDLNGRGVRARDIQAALRGTGLGPGGLAVIGQGEVSGVVQAEGSTLLGYLQEAAGLSRSVSTRQDTGARLRDAESQLAQLRLLLDEREQVAGRLATAAQQARQHRDLSARAALLEDALKRERQLGLRRELAQAQQEAQATAARSAELAAQVQQAAAVVEQARETAQQARTRRDAYAGALETLRAAREAHAQVGRYHEHLLTEQATLHTELRGLALTPPTEAAPDLTHLTAQAAEARAAAEGAERLWKALETELSRLRAAAARAAEASARASASQDTLQTELARAEGGLEQLRERLAEATAQLARATAHREQAATAFTTLDESRVATQQHERQLTQELAHLQASVSPLQRERERLETSLNQYARYGEGARNALRLDHPGIVGSVADLLTVPADYEQAVTAALGRRLEQVVVHTADDAREIIEELRRVGGRATFLPLELLRPRPRRDAALLRDPGVRGEVVGNLADLCPTEPPLVGESMLADTLLVRDLAGASRIARAYSSRPRLVTLAGEVLEPGGAMTGGRLRDTGSAVLGDQRRFQELDAELAEADTLTAHLKTQLAQVQTRLAGNRDEHAALLAAREAASRDEREAERVVTELAAQGRSLETNRDRLADQLRAQLAEQVQAQTGAAAPEMPVSQDASADPADLESQVQEVRSGAEQARERERQALEALALGRELAAAWHSYRAASTRASDLGVRLDSNRQAVQAQQAQLEAARAEVSRREQALGTLDEQEYPRAEAAREQSAQTYTTLIGEQNKLRARLDELNLTVARREGTLEPIPDGCSPAGTVREWTAELGRARAELEQLGPVNARAEVDHAAELELLAAQRAEAADAQAACDELQAHLRELETAEAAATGLAFKRVNEAFREYSTELLGGVGELEPEYSGAGRLVGLRLAVQPRGKRTRSLTLLSAGERTMAGLGFLFALNHAGGNEGMGGLPLAVLDEVDAPLDEANIRRFTAFLERFAQRGTQFLLVTHQKATMEVAQALWGVTTDQTGASRVLSIKQRGES